jgi:Protein tyrosine and serine/threonine kinase
MTTKVDTWALGAILLECWSGQPPYQSPAHAHLQIAAGKAPPVASAGRDLPPQLAAILQRCFQRRPRKRPSANTVRVQLRAARLALLPDAARTIPGYAPKIAQDVYATDDEGALALLDALQRLEYVGTDSYRMFSLLADRRRFVVWKHVPASQAPDGRLLGDPSQGDSEGQDCKADAHLIRTACKCVQQPTWLFVCTLSLQELKAQDTIVMGSSIEHSLFYGAAAGFERFERRWRLLALLRHAPWLAVLDLTYARLDGDMAAALAESLKSLLQLQVR